MINKRKNIKTTTNIVNEINTDYKASTVAADLIQHEIPFNQIEILPIGGSKRNYGKEIKNLYNYISETTGSTYTRIEINREGLYDMLPEGLFHTLATGTEVLDEDIMIHDIQKKRQEERDARLFFAPFEIELYHLRLLIELYENRLDMQTSYSEMSNLLIRNWEELKLLNNKQKIIWMHFIPEIHLRKNDLVYLEHFLKLLLNLPISIERKSVKKETFFDNNTRQSEFCLGNISLGINSITQFSNSNLTDIIEIKIGPTHPYLIKPYLPNEYSEKIIKMTTDYLLPINMEIEIIYDLIPETKFSQLTSNLTENTTLLGHTSYL